MSGGSSIFRAASIPKAKSTKPLVTIPQVKQSQPIYRTRRWMWLVLTAGWGIAVASSIMRGHMPELFAAVLLSGIVIVGVLPVLAVRAAGIEADRALSVPETTAGGELQVTLTLRMRLPLPLLWGCIREECVNESGAQPRTVYYNHVGLPWRGQEWQMTYTVRELARGVYRYGAMEVTLGDAFGLTAVTHVVTARMAGNDLEVKEIRERASFLVLPDWTGQLELPMGSGKSSVRKESRPLDASAGGYMHSTERAHSRAIPRQRTMVADGAGMQRQPYRPGDDSRHIDWRAAARGGSWVTKREVASQPPSLLMLVDTAAEAYDGSDYWFDAAAGYASAQIRYAAVNGVSFRLLDGSASTDKLIEPQQTGCLSAQREALERLTRMKPATSIGSAGQHGLEDVDAVLKREGVTRGATFLLITAEWRSGELGDRLAAYAAANGWRMEIHVLTAKRLPSTAMRARQRDWETAGMRVVWVSMSVDDDEAKQTAIVEGGEGREQASQ
jgi:uncharacterized protein (DUF58 family)